MAYRPLPSSRPSSQRDASNEYNSAHSNSPPVAPPLPQDGNLSNPPMYSNVPTQLLHQDRDCCDSITNRYSAILSACIDIEETEAFKDELALWKFNEDLEDYKPMIIDVFLDTRDMTTNQVLLLVDDNGRRRNVDSGGRHVKGGEIILERWKLELRKPVRPNPPDLPVVYKKSIVYFRTLFAQTRLLPSWNLKRRMEKSKLGNYNLKLGCRILSSDRRSLDYRCTDIGTPLVGESDSVNQYTFGPIISPAGNFNLQVSYRSMCDFRVSESEALLSSQFIHHDQGFQFRTHSDGTATRSGKVSTSQRPSLPTPGQINLQGSLSSNLPGSQRESPLNSLRTPSGSSPRHYGETTSAGRTSRSSLGSQEPSRRHSSMVFTHQPFKAPSLSASPSSYEHSTSPKLSVHRVPSSSSIQRPNSRPGSLRASSSLRSEITPVPVQQQGAQQITSSPPPSPAPRYSSSFGHRRSGSFTSAGSYRRVSTGHVEGFPDSSKLGSPFLENDDEEVADFVKMIDSKQPLKLSNCAPIIESAGSRDKNTLDRFHKLKESHVAFGESLSSSGSIQPSSLPSSSNLKKLLSDSEPVNFSSPIHLKSTSPHIPAVPSRLSEEFVGAHQISIDQSSETQRRDILCLFPTMSPKSTPLDIPSSPNIYRRVRASSFTFAPDDHMTEIRENTRKHPASLGSLDGLSAIGRISMENLNIQREKTNREMNKSPESGKSADKPAAGARTTALQQTSTSETSSRGLGSARRFISRGRHMLSPSSSTLSLTADESGRRVSQEGAKRNNSGSGSGVYNFNIGVEEDELLFAMSDMVRPSFDCEGRPASGRFRNSPAS
ncbi:Autophagy-related protein 13 [Neolecta irregularis DAH-3]|uniref:Autophagy-related protein 13 n=1 Tax=Neolecta irregularis (strain DAH-3) TaxID=1198029 RepID=A0A1U7LT74_NEOID|nr:Autophagy-related protein 13 [Neolecta irregularis DAH-3]|eukprot:OLL25829.1 Autophagy-related protein 13 [Neolecta irregularis DAH-3]